MGSRPFTIAILAAGMGTRTRRSEPKVLLPLCGRPMLEWVLDAAARLEPDRIVVVLHHGKGAVEAALGERFREFDCLVVDQGEPKGTGHAVSRALDACEERSGGPIEGDLLVLYGDSPLITREALLDLRAALEESLDGNGSTPEASLLTCEPEDPAGLGRILRDDEGWFLGIREEKDCNEEELRIPEVNTGFCCFRIETLKRYLPLLSTKNEQGEYYLTDLFGLMVRDDRIVMPIVTEDPTEVMGVNRLDQLSQARWILQERIHWEHLDRGVLIEDPATTVIEHGVEIGEGTKILPFTVIRKGVRIGRNCEVGPFSHLRVGAVLEEGAEIGNFVEMKKSTLGPGAKAKHLTYLGDATIGGKTNVGAGTITANYDGRAKHRTEIGDGAFIGSGTIIVAPAKVGNGALTGAGALVTRNSEIPEGEVWVGIPARPHRKSGSEAGEGGKA